MNPLVKKEIRLLLPNCLVILLLEIALPWFWKDQDADTSISMMPVFFFLGMIILAVDSFGREFSLNTFSSLMSQPMERRQVWRTKIIVLFSAAILIFAAYFASCELRLHEAISNANYTWHVNPKIIKDDFCNAMSASVAVMFLGLTGGLWTTLLFRQIAAAFWITLVTPIGLFFLIAFVMSQFFKSASDVVVFSVLYGAAGIYSISSFWLAHRLFHRAQDAAWTGGVINFSRWRYFESGSQSTVSVRRLRPVAALLKKEFQLHSISLICVGALLVLHIGVFILRISYANFHRNSMAGTISDFFWALWLAMPLMIGCTAVAEERKLGVAETQFCLPASRRFQFAAKFIPVLIFGVLLGGVMPLLLETLAGHLGAPSEIFKPESYSNQSNNIFGIPAFAWFEISIVALSAGLALAGFLASTLARNFLQALSIAIVIIVGICLFISFLFAGPADEYGKHVFLGMKLWGMFLPMAISILTAILFIPWLAYRNFSHFVEGGRLWRRNLLAFVGAVLFIFGSSALIYNRAWEIFEPAEPPHGPAIISSANPPKLRSTYRGYLQVQFPDGRIWFNNLGSPYFKREQWNNLERFLYELIRPLPVSAGPQQFMAGSNWVSATSEHIEFWHPGWNPAGVRPGTIVGYLDTVAVKADGTLWIPKESKPVVWTGAEMIRFGDETNWQQVIRKNPGLLLLKRDGTLWQWATNRDDWNSDWQTHWPTVRTSRLQQLGTNSDWQAITGWWGIGLARKNNGSVWSINWDWKIERQTNYDRIALETCSVSGGNSMSYIGKDGTLWVSYNLYNESNDNTEGTRRYLQVGIETNWIATVMTRTWMVALKSDGSLWQWRFRRSSEIHFPEEDIKIPPTRLGIHNDWLGLTGTWDGAVALAADGSLWFWPNPDYYSGAMMKAPKQPQLLGNVFGKAD
jgi:ABC-type transport system involved in multi-copper enzyme maturation permease subunit